MKEKIKLYPAFKYIPEKRWEHLREQKSDKYIMLDRSMTGEVKIGFFDTLKNIAKDKHTYRADAHDAEIIFNYL